MPVLMGFFALALTLFALKAYTKASPAILARMIRRGGGFLLMALGGLLLARGRIDFGLALGAAGLWIMGRSERTGLRNAGAGGAGVSRVRSAMIEMELDHATGAIRGMILAGRNEGKRLDALTRPALLDLYNMCLRDDPDGARLLEAYLDRRFAGWRAASDPNRDSGGGETRARRAGTITEDEAYEILGLKKGAAAADIARAHRDLMKKLHPDLGGTTDLAARVNEAKDVLMRRHH
ncbi:DnaJ domain-containing protein [Methylocystis sp. JR02]|uniref:DnaJ domain-containing protein n=1 Tax=Methylocystis sp. JR02 TaxID=3046284 RepID=UPI0024B97179|nr:DnaJ domain-containing protein [Methylocystis sp. JR02]MDJ0447994.1 DnaJ domain-containing protein [Methylocystis sp. JR02]